MAETPRDIEQSELDTHPIEACETPYADSDQEELTVVPTMSPVAMQPVLIADDGRFKTGKLKGLTMGSAIFVLAWPVILESMLNSTVGLVDTKLSAGLEQGEAATDAIGGASYIMWLIGLVIMAIGVGATALIARSIGKGRVGVANAVLGQAVTLAVASGATIGLIVWLLSGSVALLLNMTPEASSFFSDYMRIIAIGTPATSVLFALIACSRGAGDSVSPLVVMVVRNVVNIIISWGASGVEVFGMRSPLGLDLGVTGIALGTVLGDLAGAWFIWRVARTGRWGIRLKAIRMKPHMLTIVRLVRLGVPNFLETFGMWIGNFFIISFVGLLSTQLGTEGLLGAHIIGIRIEAFSFMPGFGVGMAAATLAGQYLGMGRADLAKKAVWRCALIAVAFMGLFGVLLILIPRQITAMLSTQPIHLAEVPPLLIICGVVQVPFALSIVLRAAMRGAGDVKAVMALTWFSTYAVRLPLAYLVSGVDIPIPEWLGGGMIMNPDLPSRWFGLEPGLTMLWIALCSEMALRAVLFSTRFFQGGWSRVKV
ncbi:MAG: MATE family efflux transporter [Phycisphaerales bacterium]|nr:MATE family efflux transporter [Phycisphaerales bacterium]